MNVVVIQGRIVNDLQIKYSGSGMAMLGIRVAVNRRKKGETDFINCQAFDKTAENIQAYLHKGSRILIRGHIQTGSYQNKEGKNVYTTDVIVDEFDFIDSKDNGGGGQQNYQPQAQYQPPQSQPQYQPPQAQYDDIPQGFAQVEESLPF